MTESLEARLRERTETERFHELAQDLLQAADTIAAQRYRIKALEDLTDMAARNMRWAIERDARLTNYLEAARASNIALGLQLSAAHIAGKRLALEATHSPYCRAVYYRQGSAVGGCVCGLEATLQAWKDATAAMRKIASEELTHG